MRQASLSGAVVSFVAMLHIACTPCEPGPIARTEWTRTHVTWDTQRLPLLEQRLQTIEYAVSPGQCAPEDVPVPKVFATSPSGQRRECKTGISEPPYGPRWFDLSSSEPGNYSVELEFTPTTTASLLALVAADRTGTTREVLDGLACVPMSINRSGTIGCTELRILPPEPDAGFRSRGVTRAVIVMSGERRLTFEDESRIFKGTDTFWVVRPDAGVERYVDTGAGSVNLDPAGLLPLPEVVLDVVPVGPGAWVLTQNALRWVEPIGGDLMTLNQRPLSPVVGDMSAVVGTNNVAHVANYWMDVTPGRALGITTCGYRRNTNGSLDAMASGCVAADDFLQGSNGRYFWIFDGNELVVRGIPDGEEELAVLARLLVPGNFSGNRQYLGQPQSPVYNLGPSGYAPRFLGGQIVIEAYPYASTEYGGWTQIRYADDEIVSRIVLESTPTEKSYTVYYRRP